MAQQQLGRWRATWAYVAPRDRPQPWVRAVSPARRIAGWLFAAAAVLVYLGFGAANVVILVHRLSGTEPTSVAVSARQALLGAIALGLGPAVVASGAALLAARLLGGSVATLGMSMRHPWAQLRQAGLVVLPFLFIASVAGGGLVLAELGYSMAWVRHVYLHDAVPAGHGSVLLWRALIIGFSAGVGEEVVVLALTVRLLEASPAGRRSALVTMLAVALRVSYHLRYGLGALPIAVWAYLSVKLYRRTRALWPFVVAHAAYDAVVLLEGYPVAKASLFVVPSVAAMLLVIAAAGRGSLRPPRAARAYAVE